MDVRRRGFGARAGIPRVQRDDDARVLLLDLRAARLDDAAAQDIGAHGVALGLNEQAQARHRRVQGGVEGRVQFHECGIGISRGFELAGERTVRVRFRG